MAAEIAGVCEITGLIDLIFCKCLSVKNINLCINRILDKGRSLHVELGYTKRLSPNILDVSVDDVACDR